MVAAVQNQSDGALVGKILQRQQPERHAVV